MADATGGSDGRARIVHVVHSLNGRTLADIAAQLADAMVDGGHQVAVVAANRTAGARPLPPRVRTFVLDVPEHRSTVWAIARLRSLLARLAPDVVFAHGNGPTRATILASVTSRHRPRVVGVEHNHYSSYPWSMRGLRDRLNALVLPRADALIGVSGGVAEDLVSTFPALRGRVHVVPEPLTRYADLARLAAEPVDHPWFDDGVPVVTSVGHVHPRKDHRTLVRAMARVRDSAGSSAARLVIIGAAEGEEAAHVRALVEELDLGDQVTLLGAQDNPLRFVARSTAFALSSRNEGMPVSILEAMALGIPVVSTDAPSGPAWILEGGTRGLLVPVGDDAALADALRRIVQDGELRERFARWGATRAADFSPARVADGYLAVAGLAPDTAAW
ncbi:glycosyltransferase [Nitriliruptor alkaliphilus]|uniref:glycosyltransferase n=1 Tax=Nitriliruptor alkaliphilus TaxID=427918 RepID=UPI00069909AD|nr:glycosyltransferase [Nitriliruptor alkaliphilus]